MAKKATRAYAPREVCSMKRRVIELTGKWRDAFGTPVDTGVWLIWGASGNGKTSFVMQLCKELTKFGKVVYNSLEEGVSSTMITALEQHNMTEVNGRFLLLDSASMEELEERMNKPRSPKFYVIDSFQYTGLNAAKYKEFVMRHPNKLIIFTSHADGRKPKGRTAETVMYDATQKIHVEGFRAHNNGRSRGTEEFFTIYAEGARKYWGDQGGEAENEKLNELNN